MDAKIKYTGDIGDDILKANGLDELDFYLANQKKINYRPENLSSLKEFLDKHKNKFLAITDCDADGLSAAGVLRSYFPDVPILYGDRSGDRGISCRVLDYICAYYGDSITGIITLDNGITSVDAVEYAKSLGYEVFITDHHLPADRLPNCNIINPHIDSKADFKDLCGAGVIYICLKHLYKTNYDALQYAAIGTICDVVPILYDNRYIVKQGMRYLRGKPNAKIKDVLDELKINFQTERDIAWYLGPAINAASRLNQTEVAMQSFVEGNIAVSGKLSELNKQRKKLTKIATEEAKIILTESAVFAEIPPTDVAIAGIIAIKIAEQYSKPGCVFSETNGKYACSIRTLDIIDANDYIQSSKYVSGGGHAAAGGFSFEKEDKDNFIAELTSYVVLHGTDTRKIFTADIEIDIDEAMGLYKKIAVFAPYGEGFRQPVFLSRNVNITEQSLTANGHLKLSINGHTAYYYNHQISSWPGYVDIAYELDYNFWKKDTFLKILKVENHG